MNTDTTTKDQSDCGCKDNQKPHPTEMAIYKQRSKYCLDLYDSRGATAQQETKYEGEKDVYYEKRCLFRNTEDNYRRYRNLDITVGQEVLQTTDSIKANVDKLKKWNSDLNSLLKKLSKSVKDTKTKFSELKDTGCKLESSIKDKCWAAQWKALTGKQSEDCKETPKPPIDECKDAAKNIEKLICKPKGLILDIDSIFQSSSDVIGIQLFSNIDTLEPLYKDLDTYGKDFEKQISEATKTRETDVKNLVGELQKSVKEITKSAMDRNSLRADFEGWYDALSFLCCPPCDCVTKGGKTDETNDPNKQGGNNDCYNNCTPRLKGCEDDICDICDRVKQSFCCTPTDSPKPPPTQKPTGCC
jgi:hypothetical protein